MKNCVSFVDGMVILTNDSKEVQRIIEKLEEGMKVCAMKVSVGKTKFVRVNNNEKITLIAG